MTSKQKRGKQAPSLITLRERIARPHQKILARSSDVLQFVFKCAKIEAKTSRATVARWLSKSILSREHAQTVGLFLSSPTQVNSAFAQNIAG